MRIHPCANRASGRFLTARRGRERHERRHGNDALAAHERQPLNRGNADAESGECSRSGGNRKKINGRDRDAAQFDDAENIAGQSFGVRSRRIADLFDQHFIVVDNGDAASGRRGVQSQHTHLLDLQNMSTSATPAMRQYLDAKQQHRDAILFFRMGDFYEMFYEDALLAARTLELTLTSRSKDTNGGGIPMCGVPFHAVDTYIARLVKKGFRVAICEQVEDPRKAKGLVRREVVRVVSPGTLTDAGYLDAREPAFLMAVATHAEII